MGERIGKLEMLLHFFVNKMPGPVLAEFARRAYNVQISSALHQIASEANSELIYGVGRVTTVPALALNLRDRMTLHLFETYRHLIPVTYREAGLKMAEHDGQRPVFYDPKTGKVYS